MSEGEDGLTEVEGGFSVLAGVLCRVIFAMGVRASRPSEDSTRRMAVVFSSFLGVVKAVRGGIEFWMEVDLNAGGTGVVGFSESFNEGGGILGRLEGGSEG